MTRARRMQEPIAPPAKQPAEMRFSSSPRVKATSVVLLGAFLFFFTGWATSEDHLVVDWSSFQLDSRRAPPEPGCLSARGGFRARRPGRQHHRSCPRHRKRQQ